VKEADEAKSIRPTGTSGTGGPVNVAPPVTVKVNGIVAALAVPAKAAKAATAAIPKFFILEPSLLAWRVAKVSLAPGFSEHPTAMLILPQVAILLLRRS